MDSVFSCDKTAIHYPPPEKHFQLIAGALPVKTIQPGVISEMKGNAMVDE